MSFTLNCQQYNNAFQPKRLGNWEVPALRDREPAPRPPGFRTTTVVDDNGHLLPEVGAVGLEPYVVDSGLLWYFWPGQLGSDLLVGNDARLD